MAKRHKPDLTLPRLRSALTNGKFVVAGTDHRSAWMRRLRDLVQAHISDFGGDSEISHSERMLINRASMLALQLEMMEQKFADTDGVAGGHDLNMYQRGLNTLRRTLESLGLERRTRDVTPLTVEQWKRQKLADKLDAEEDVVAAE